MRTNNYLGSRDENRGIVLFCLVFGVLLAIGLGITFVVNSNTKDNGVKSQNAISSIVENEICDINTFEEHNGNLVIEGILSEEVNEYIIRRLQNVEIVLKDSKGDKYEYSTDYYISTEGVEFSSILEEEKESKINLEDILSGEYYVLLRVKYESTNNENGFIYKYYTFKNNTENNNIEFDGINVYFDSLEDSITYLTIEKK